MASKDYVEIAETEGNNMANPMDMMKLAQRLQIFSSQHPRAIAFLRDTAQNVVQTGTIIEMKVTTPDGHERISNIKLTQEDLETIEILKNLKK